MDKLKIVGLIFEFCLIAVGLSLFWHYTGFAFTGVSLMFGAFSGMIGGRIVKWTYIKIKTALQAPH